MTDIQIVLLILFVVFMIIGYFLIANVPTLLHTPLMSGMNALSGITVLGALIATSLVVDNSTVATILGGIAVVVATINVVGGFAVTDRMLGMFKGGHKHDR